MKKIKNLMVGIFLGVSVSLLSACGDDNPVLEPKMMKVVENIVVDFADESSESCIEYWSKPDDYKSRQSVCKIWMNYMYGYFQSNLEENSSPYDDDVFIPSRKFFEAPEVWKEVNKTCKKILQVKRLKK